MELDHAEKTYLHNNKKGYKKSSFKGTCGKVGHYARDCRSKPKAKVANIEEQTENIELTHIEENKEQLLRFNGKINGHPAWILLNFEASRNFLDEKFVEKCKLSTQKLPSATIELADG